MKAGRFLAVLFALGSTFPTTVPSHAQDRPDNRPIITLPTNERGFTLGDILDTHLWSLVRHPFSAALVSQVSTTVHQVPTRGVQFQLLTPGDIGATLHLRW